jgi:hypothetical protein
MITRPLDMCQEERIRGMRDWHRFAKNKLDKQPVQRALDHRKRDNHLLHETTSMRNKTWRFENLAD